MSACVLTWTPAVERGGPRFESYQLLRDGVQVFLGSIERDEFGGVTAQTLTYTDTTVTGGVTYEYQVIAFDSSGHGISSGPIYLTPAAAPQGFSITAAAGMAYFDSGQQSVGYYNVFSNSFGSMQAPDYTIGGYPVLGFYVSADTSGDEEFYIVLGNSAPTDLAFTLDFTDSNGVAWHLPSNSMTAISDFAPLTFFDLMYHDVAGAAFGDSPIPYPLLIAGVTYPITVS